MKPIAIPVATIIAKIVPNTAPSTPSPIIRSAIINAKAKEACKIMINA